MVGKEEEKKGKITFFRRIVNVWCWIHRKVVGGTCLEERGHWGWQPGLIRRSLARKGAVEKAEASYKWRIMTAKRKSWDVQLETWEEETAKAEWRRGRKKMLPEVSCSNGRNWSIVNKLGKILLKSSSFEGDLHQVDPLEGLEINYPFSVWPYLVSLIN